MELDHEWLYNHDYQVSVVSSVEHLLGTRQIWWWKYSILEVILKYLRIAEALKVGDLITHADHHYVMVFLEKRNKT